MIRCATRMKIYPSVSGMKSRSKRNPIDARTVLCVALVGLLVVGAGCAAPEGRGEAGVPGVRSTFAPKERWDFAKVDELSRSLSREAFIAAGAAGGNAESFAGEVHSTPFAASVGGNYYYASWFARKLSNEIRAWRIALKKRGQAEPTSMYFTRVLIARREMNRYVAVCHFRKEVEHRFAVVNGLIEQIQPYYPETEWSDSGPVR